MMKFRIHQPYSTPSQALSALSRREDAIAATEFALVLPFLLLLIMGVIELSNVMTVERRLLNSVQSTADLISQETDVTSADMSEIFTAAKLTLSPFSIVGFGVGTTSVRFNDTSGVPFVDWSHGLNGGTVADPLIKADGRGEPGDSVIIVTGTYTYEPLLSMIIPNNIILTETSYARPRKVRWVLKH
ncbi:TadE/TadG family type IV pilus assembly protein [Pseudomonadota bacterium]